MRPVFFLSLLTGITAPPMLVAQDAVYLALREPCWTAESTGSNHGFGWSGFTRQYFCTSGWNATGIGGQYRRLAGISSVFLVRDGISGFSWYHLYLAHKQLMGQVTALVQLRFSTIRVTGQAPVFRVGVNLDLMVPAHADTRIGLSVFDLSGFLFPRAAPARGDPTVRLQAWHTPGRQLDLLAALDLSPARPGPLSLGARINLGETLRVSGMFRVLPLSFTLGLEWSIRKIRVVFSLNAGSVVGVTPMMIVSGDRL